MANGKFITFEGGEGAGKSTQLNLLAKTLEAKGISIVQTREPGGSPGGEQIRTLLVDGPAERWQPLTEALLHSAARLEHLTHLVRPALAEGKWVLCDRYVDSTLAYQGHGHRLGKAAIETLQCLVTDGLLPDLTLVIDLPVELGLSRAAQRSGGAARYESMGADYHERVRQGFLKIAESDRKRCSIIDGQGELEDVQAEIWAEVSRRFGIDPR